MFFNIINNRLFNIINQDNRRCFVAKNKKNKRLGEFVLQGEICLGQKWCDNLAQDFHIKSSAEHFFHAKRVALGRLKAYSRRCLERSNHKNFLLRKVVIYFRGKKAVLQPKCKNKGLLFKKKVEEVFI
jgi:hypothetical protein